MLATSPRAVRKQTDMVISANLLAPQDRARPMSEAEAKAAAKFAGYEAHLHRAEAHHARGQLEAAAVHAAIAAHSAAMPHAGFFASPRLERLLTDIGRRTSAPTAYRRAKDHSGEIKHILHVATAVNAVGGLTNMLAHWIEADSTRTHSLALTQHRGPLPAKVAGAVTRSGGRAHFVNRTMGGQIAWAAKLRELARGYDAIVLHVYSQDVIPLIAFADADERPPLLFLNHGDHLFWLGASISDVVINLRDAAQDLSIARRAIAEPRNVMVPTITVPSVRKRSREEAKSALGLAPDSVLLFSAARGMKYRTVNGISFADTHVELLRRHPKAELWVLGAGDPEDWRAASAAVNGRIKPLAETPDKEVYFEAADIYVDSFPFVSSTSLMEAAGYGAPLVSRFYWPKDARIFAINHPGLLASTLQGSSESEYVDILARLINDPALRAEKGAAARDIVAHYHTPPSWLDFLETAYARALELAPVDSRAVFRADEIERFSFGEPDRRLYEVFGFDDETLAMMKPYLGLLPLPQRLTLWRTLRKAGVFTSIGESARMLLPEWLVRVLKDRA
jgi:hypothetical protein